MSKLPPNFQFTQGSLQDYVDCPRRFHLRYILQLAWPASVSEPMREHEKRMKRGERFHRLAEQYLIGLPSEDLHAVAHASPDQYLEDWWENFIKVIPSYLNGMRFVEKTISMPVDKFRLSAKYDLVIFDPFKGITIFDWKTSHLPIRRSILSGRLQTKVYSYVMVCAGKEITGGQPVDTNRVELVYWSAAYPQTTVRFQYNQEQYENDHRFIIELIREIASLPENQFPLIENVETCRYCVYRSLCDRGISAGDDTDQEMEEEPPKGMLDFTLDQIEEISY